MVLGYVRNDCNTRGERFNRFELEAGRFAYVNIVVVAGVERERPSDVARYARVARVPERLAYQLRYRRLTVRTRHGD